MAKELKLEYAIAVGSGPFPFDMLRYDHCFPGSEIYSSEMGRDHYDHDRVVIVSRYQQQPGRWTTARWKSFGWELITFGPGLRAVRGSQDGRRQDPERMQESVRCPSSK